MGFPALPLLSLPGLMPAASSGCDYPAASDVRAGTTYDSGALTGTLTLPLTSQVLLGIQYGAGGTEFVGTLVATTGDFVAMGRLTHSPADIVRWLLIDLGLATDPLSSVAWPAYASNEPGFPDAVITVSDTVGIDHGSSMIDGGLFRDYGISVRVRSVNHKTGWAKVDSIQNALASVYQHMVTIDGTSYLVHCLSGIGAVANLGKDSPTSKRDLFTVNALLTVNQIA